MNASTRTIKSPADTIEPAREPLSEKLAGAAHDAVDRVAQRADKAERVIRGAAAGSSEAVEDKLDTARQEIEAISVKAERYAKANPIQSAGIAFGAGVLISLLLRR